MTPSWNTLVEGDRPEARTIGPLTRTDFVRYQGASGDMNALHHDDQVARAAGFPSVFSVGMFQAGVLASYAADWLGPENLRRFTCRFRAQVWPDDVLTCEATVTRKYDEDGERRVDLDLSCCRQDGSTAVSGVATFAVPSASSREES